MSINLNRPLVFFDLETTGTDIANDRIVEISLVKLFPDGREEVNTFRINPGIPIPEGATTIHGITDADVADKPSFSDLAEILLVYSPTQTYAAITSQIRLPSFKNGVRKK